MNPANEPWFWGMLSKHKPNLERLESSLHELDRPTLEKFLVCYHIASETVCEPWDGPYIDEEIGNLSEDSTEDLTDWIVAQGIEAWAYAQSERANWHQMFCIANKYHEQNDDPIPKWFEPHPMNTESEWGAAKSAATNVFYERFAESFYDVQEDLYEKYDPKFGT